MHKNESEKHNSRSAQWFRYILIPAALLVVGGVCLCRYTPRAYQPRPAADPEQVSPYLTHKLGPDFVNQVQLDQPFELVVEQEGLNDIIRRLPWIEQFDGFTFTNPVVLFYRDRIYLLGTLNYKAISSVVTVIANPQMTSQGEISLNILSIRLGVIPVTKLAGYLAVKGFEHSRGCFEGEPELEAVVRALVHNQPFEPVFKIADQTVRVTAFSVIPQQLTLAFEPE